MLNLQSAISVHYPYHLYFKTILILNKDNDFMYVQHSLSFYVKPSIHIYKW